MGGLERQSENPTIDLLDRLAETLGVQLSEFFVQPPRGATTPKTLPKGRKPIRPKRKQK
ncbi:putative transcriptional regulator [Bradyrhizobiaceae bacterium SG-6C]|nr:putative transcriptional regulator [Bradyrhizobiaceae bacterium SG-6C]